MDVAPAPADAYAIERLAHGQVGRLFRGRPAVIVPLGGCEPLGDGGALGAESACALAASAEVSARCRVPRAPLLPFGCSTPFIAFAGAAGIKPRTFVNLLCEILHAYVFQGAERIFLISAAPFNREPALEALRRIEAKYPRVKAALFDINTVLTDGGDAAIGAGGKRRKKGAEGGGRPGFDRDDALLLSLAAYLRPDMSAPPAPSARPNLAEPYKTWRRRGRDPQKLRKLAPDALLLSPDTDNITPERGGEYFNGIVNIIQARVESMLLPVQAPEPPERG